MSGLHLLEKHKRIVEVIIGDKHIYHLPVELFAWYEALLAGNVTPELPGHIELAALTVRLDERGVRVHGALPRHRPAAPAEGVQRAGEPGGVAEAHAGLKCNVYKDFIHLHRVLLNKLDRAVEACCIHERPLALVALEENADGVGIDAGPLFLHDIDRSPSPGKITHCKHSTEERVVGGGVGPEAAVLHLLEQFICERQGDGARFTHVLL
mmetsp:Transcript_11565/g.32549  ORF Transcript_11565/g.32549 Transcript_11565/m.32549 type:complete len:210 (+) Transcript_11565:1254-1883(+)